MESLHPLEGTCNLQLALAGEQSRGIQDADQALTGRRCTVCDFFPGGNKAVCIDDNFLFALDLDDLGATIRCATMIYKARNIPRLSS